MLAMDWLALSTVCESCIWPSESPTALNLVSIGFMPVFGSLSEADIVFRLSAMPLMARWFCARMLFNELEVTSRFSIVPLIGLVSCWNCLTKIVMFFNAESKSRASGLACEATKSATLDSMAAFSVSPLTSSRVPLPIVSLISLSLNRPVLPIRASVESFSLMLFSTSSVSNTWLAWFWSSCLLNTCPTCTPLIVTGLEMSKPATLG